MVTANDLAGAVPAKKKPKKVLLIAAITALALIVVGGGVAFAGNQFGWFRGPQPAAALPAGAVGYVQFDADPSVDQKLAALSFLRDVKSVASANGNADVKKLIWDAFVDENPSASEGIDYDKDLKPWLGNRFGVAVYPKSSSQPMVATAVQVTDENLAKTKIPELLGDNGSVLLGFKDGFAVITTEAFKDDLAASFGSTALTNDAVFSSDFRSLGDPGWVAGWGSLKELSEMSGSSYSSAASVASAGRVAMTLRFTNDTAQLKMMSLGIDPTAIPKTSVSSDVGGLPASTGAVVSIKGAGAIFTSAWKKYVEDTKKNSGYDIEESLAKSGWRMPDDAVTVLGDQITIAISEDGLQDLADGNIGLYNRRLLEMGARVTTDDPSAAKSVVNRFLGEIDSSDMVEQDVRDNTYILASSSSYVDELAKGSGGLGTQPKFTKVVPNWQNASALGYLDLGPFSSKMAQSSGEYSQFVGSLQAIGLTSTYNQDTAESTIILSRS